MPRRSNPTFRVIQIIDFLASHPTDNYGLSELARNLGMSKTTCLSIVTALVASGYLVQHPIERYYAIGPSVLAAGQSALLRFPDVTAAIPAMRRLSNALRMPVVLSASAGDQIVVVARAGGNDALHGVARTGMRIPLIPPYGSPLIAWAGREKLDEYLLRARPRLAAREQAALRRSLSIGRRRGYFATNELPKGHRLADRLGKMRTWTRSADPNFYRLLGATSVYRFGYFIDEIEERAVYEVSGILVPVHSQKDAPAMMLTIPSYGWRPSGRSLARTARQMVDAAADIAGLYSS